MSQIRHISLNFSPMFNICSIIVTVIFKKFNPIQNTCLCLLLLNQCFPIPSALWTPLKFKISSWTQDFLGVCNDSYWRQLFCSIHKTLSLEKDIVQSPSNLSKNCPCYIGGAGYLFTNLIVKQCSQHIINPPWTPWKCSMDPFGNHCSYWHAIMVLSCHRCWTSVSCCTLAPTWGTSGTSWTSPSSPAPSSHSTTRWRELNNKYCTLLLVRSNELWFC